MRSVDYCMIALVLSIVVIVLASDMLKGKLTTISTNTPNTPNLTKENFVAWNNEEVREE